MYMTEQGGVWSCPKHGAFPDITRDTSIEAGLNINGNWPLCPTCIVIKEKDLCRDCEKHPATLNFSDSGMDYIHGNVTSICQCCYVKRIEKILADVQENLKIQIEKLNAKPCDPFEPESA